MGTSLKKHALARKLLTPKIKDKLSELYLKSDESKDFMHKLKKDGLYYFSKDWEKFI